MIVLYPQSLRGYGKTEISLVLPDTYIERVEVWWLQEVHKFQYLFHPVSTFQDCCFGSYQPFSPQWYPKVILSWETSNTSTSSDKSPPCLVFPVRNGYGHLGFI